MDNKEYRKHHAISNSDLTLISDNIEHFEHARNSGKEDTASQSFGTGFHCFYLEPKKFKKTYRLIPDDIKPGSSKAYKEFKEQAEIDGVAIVTKDTVEAYEEMKVKVDSLKLFRGGIAEEPVFGKMTAVNEEIEVKCRPDYRLPTMILDLKTSQSANPEQFDKSVRNYRYFVQAAFYMDICLQSNPLLENFVFVVIESSAPFSVAAYELDPGYMEAGRIQYKKDLEKYIYDKRMNRKGYEPGVKVLTPPDWFMRQYINT